MKFDETRVFKSCMELFNILIHPKLITSEDSLKQKKRIFGI